MRSAVCWLSLILIRMLLRELLLFYYYYYYYYYYYILREKYFLVHTILLYCNTGPLRQLQMIHYAEVNCRLLNVDLFICLNSCPCLCDEAEITKKYNSIYSPSIM